MLRWCPLNIMRDCRGVFAWPMAGISCSRCDVLTRVKENGAGLDRYIGQVVSTGYSALQ